MGDIRDDVKSTFRTIKVLSADVLFSTAKDCAYSSVRDVLDNLVNRIQDIEFGDKRHDTISANWYDKIKLMLLDDVEKLLGNANNQYMVRAMADLCDTLHVASQSVNKVTRIHRKSYFYLVYAAHMTKAPKLLELFRSLVEIERDRVSREKQLMDTQNAAAIDAINHTKQQQQQRIVELT